MRISDKAVVLQAIKFGDKKLILKFRVSVSNRVGS